MRSTLTHSRRRPLVLTVASLACVAFANAGAAGCANAAAGGSVSIALSEESVPADGLSTVIVTATVSPPDAAAMLTFELAGIGYLSATNVAVGEGGVAVVELVAPTEDYLTAASASSTITARIPTADPVVPPPSASAVVSFTVPSEGPPMLIAYTVPDRVLAGGTEPLVLFIEGRRLTSNELTIEAASAAVDIPASVTLTADGALGFADISIPPPAARTVIPITIRGGGAQPVDVDLRFIAEGDPEFDLTGTFAQVSYGASEISEFFLLDPATQCIVSTSVSLLRIVQDGDQVTIQSEACSTTMGATRLIGGFTITPGMSQAFLDAMNELSPPAPPFTLPSVELGVHFELAPGELPPVSVIGAELTDPVDGELPTDPTDPTQRDHDGDGEPGVTIEAGSFDQHVCTRTVVTSMSGTIESSDAIVDGLATAETESKVFGSNGDGASPKMRNVPAKWAAMRVDGVNRTPDIAGRRGDPDVIGCDDVAAFVDELKARFPAPNQACN